MQELVVRPAQVFREKLGLDIRLGHRAERIDLEAKQVSGLDQEGREFALGYDKLLLATGADAILPDLPGVDQQGVFVLKHLEHGRKIQEYLDARQPRQAVLLGMGYVALEMAEALRSRDIQVSLLKPRPEVLPWLHPELSQMVQKELEDNGVELYPGYTPLQIQSQGQGLRIKCSPELNLNAELVLAAIGITPNSKLAADAGLELGPARAIAVDDQLQTSDPNIFAVGDCADAWHVVSGQRTWIPLALRANRSGRAAAQNIMGGQVRLRGVAGSAMFKVFGLEVARTGLSQQEAEQAGFSPVSMQIEAPSRGHGYPGASPLRVCLLADQGSGQLLGGQITGREGAAHRINTLAVALHNKMNVEEFAQSDLAYAPPFGPAWDPLLTAANQLQKKI
jgi:NADPH-dependent 2,4-dienoyl-CoA reductase/sulfur reductase-like enzyme